MGNIFIDTHRTPGGRREVQRCYGRRRRGVSPTELYFLLKETPLRRLLASEMTVASWCPEFSDRHFPFLRHRNNFDGKVEVAWRIIIFENFVIGPQYPPMAFGRQEMQSRLNSKKAIGLFD